MSDNMAGRDAPGKQSQNSSKTFNVNNLMYSSEVWKNKIFNTNKNAGMIARDILNINKKNKINNYINKTQPQTSQKPDIVRV